MRKNVWKVLLLAAVLCFAGCGEADETKAPATNTPEITMDAEETTEKTDLPVSSGETDETDGKETPEPTKEADGTSSPAPTEEPEATEVPEPTGEVKATEAPNATATPVPTTTPKPTATSVPTIAPEPDSAQISQKNDNILNVQQGDIVTFGRYEQDGDLSNGPEDIEWYVVGREGDRALVLSKYILDCMVYDAGGDDVSWEDAGLRDWLRGEFFTEAFTTDEWDYMDYMELENNGNPYLNVPGGEKTKDNLFALSIDELEKYTPESSYDDFEWYWFGNRYYEWLDNAQATEYAIQQGVQVWPWEDSDIYKCGNWWLRSPGEDSTKAMFYNFSGFVDLEGFRCNTYDVGVRPAVWVDLMSMAEDFGVSEDVPEDKQEDMPEEEPVVQPENGSGLQANPGKVFSFNDIKFFGQSFVGMDIDKAETLLKAEGMFVEREEKTSFDGEPYINVTGGYNEWMFTYWVKADVSSGIVDVWSVQDDYGFSNKKIPIGLRDLYIKDTLGKVLDRLGFANAYQVETELKEIISGVSEDDWFGGVGLTKADNEVYELFSISGVPNLYAQAVVTNGDYLSITFYDNDFDAENGGNMHSYLMEFMRSEESNGEFALINAMMNIYIPD